MKSLSKPILSESELQGITPWAPSVLDGKVGSVLFNFPNLDEDFELTGALGSKVGSQPGNDSETNASENNTSGQGFRLLDFQNLRIEPTGKNINKDQANGKQETGPSIPQPTNTTKHTPATTENPANIGGVSADRKKILVGLVSKEHLDHVAAPLTVQAWDFSELFIPHYDENGEEQDLSIIENGGMVSREEIEKSREIRHGLEKEIAQAKIQLERAREEAEELIKNARETAALLMEEVNNQVEHIKLVAFNQGAEMAKADKENIMRKLQQVIEEAQAWREQVLSKSESTIIGMLKQIGKKMYGNGFKLDPHGVEEMVGRAISEASKLGNLRVYLNPQDEELLISLWQDTELMVNGQKIQLVPSINIQQGGCFIEGEFGTMDSRIESQFELIEKEIDNTLSNSEKEAEGKK